MHTFRDLETAAYCARKLYHRHREADVDVPDVSDRRNLAFEYEHLLDIDAALLAAPIEVSPATFRERVEATKRECDAWADIADPPRREVRLTGKDCRGVAHKVLERPLAPSLVFTGDPPDQGVWEPQAVRLVAAAKALAWERERPVDRAFAEYPTHGVIREVPLTTRRKAAYRRALGTADRIDGPPPRAANDAKCAPCEYRETCSPRTQTLASKLGL